VLNALQNAGVQLQPIGDGYGPYQYDSYSIVVDQMPPGLTPESLLQEMAHDMNATIDNSLFDSINYFTRRDAGGTQLGDIYDIDLFGPDDGAVVLTSLAADHFVFSTITDPGDLFGTHPEYGSREFGFERNTDGSITFYTRASSRPRDAAVAAADNIRVTGWSSMMAGLSNVIDARGGQSRPNSFERRFFEVVGASSPLTVGTSSNDLIFDLNGVATAFVNDVIALADAKLSPHGIVISTGANPPPNSTVVDFEGIPFTLGFSDNYVESLFANENMRKTANDFNKGRISAARRDFLFSEALNSRDGGSISLNVLNLFLIGLDLAETKHTLAHTIVHELGHQATLIHEQSEESDIMFSKNTQHSKSYTADFVRSLGALRLAVGQSWTRAEGDETHEYFTLNDRSTFKQLYDWFEALR
jgi:hypothetical protein